MAPTLQPVLLGLTFFALLRAGTQLISPQAGSTDTEEAEHRSWLDMYGTGQACPENAAEMWGVARNDHIGWMGRMESSASGVYEQTLIIGRSGQPRAALTCADRVLVEKCLCTPGNCNTCTSNDRCAGTQVCVRRQCKQNRSRAIPKDVLETASLHRSRYQ